MYCGLILFLCGLYTLIIDLLGAYVVSFWSYWQNCVGMICQVLNSSLPEQNDCHFEDNIFKCIFMNGKVCLWIQISLKFVPKGPIDNKSMLVQVMAWRRGGDKPLTEPMLTRFTDTYRQR